MKSEEQGTIISNWKLTELYDIFANNEAYEKYINDLFAVSNEFTKRAVALSALHTEAFMQIRKKQEFDPASNMCQMYDGMSEEDQKRFCQDIFQKKGFFEESVKMIQAWFESAREVGEGDSGGDVNEGLSGKVNEKMEK